MFTQAEHAYMPDRSGTGEFRISDLGPEIVISDPTRSYGRTPMPSLKRSHLVWATLAGSMTCVTGLLSLFQGQQNSTIALTEVTGVTDRAETPTSHIESSAAKRAFAGIVIHHSGSNQGSAETLRADHEARGLVGLGYHFVIGNGRGASDGSIETGERWESQLPGAHVVGPRSLELNNATIGICLVGNGDTRPFTDAQLASLINLVRELQAEYNIPSGAVMLHRDVAPIASPGRLFPEFAFETRLLAG